jgi:hypothetical protein
MIPRKRVVDEHLRFLGPLADDQALGLLAVPEKAGSDEHEDAEPEDEAALPLQASLTEKVFETAIGHESLPFRLAPQSGEPPWSG